jgi:hypothetical protein
MIDANVMLEELTELIAGNGFLQADYDRILSIIQGLEEEESEERLSPDLVAQLRILSSRF